MKAAKTLPKGSEVKELMEGILIDIHLLATNRSIRAVTGEQVKQLFTAIEDIKNLDPLLLEDSDSGGQQVIQTHSGSGHNVAGQGNVHSGSGSINDSRGGAITQNYGSR